MWNPPTLQSLCWPFSRSDLIFRVFLELEKLQQDIIVEVWPNKSPNSVITSLDVQDMLLLFHPGTTILPSLSQGMCHGSAATLPRSRAECLSVISCRQQSKQILSAMRLDLGMDQQWWENNVWNHWKGAPKHQRGLTWLEVHDSIWLHRHTNTLQVTKLMEKPDTTHKQGMPAGTITDQCWYINQWVSCLNCCSCPGAG